MILYCATTNPGKLREFAAEALPDLTDIPPPEETGSTFEENAIAKALYYGAYTSEYLFAEDSGLEVRALDGAPGVLSARFAGPDATDAGNNALLLERLRGVRDRAARYVCVIALVNAGQLVRTFRGTVEGLITEEPRGTNGFGYDPLFYYPPFGCTFGQASPEQKQQVSHRSRALAALREYITRLGA